MESHVFVAGTFDGLHMGHRAVLERAFAEGRRVTVGITTDAFVSKFKTSKITPFEERKHHLEIWLYEKGWIERATILGIEDSLEPAASGHYDALIVTEQNRSTGEKINVIRHERALPALSLLLVQLVPAEDGKPISSSRMRMGEIDAWGKLILPEHMRSELKLPMGDIVSIQTVLSLVKKKDSLLITVGDITTDRMLTNGIVPDLSIIDLYAERVPYKAFHDYKFPEGVQHLFLKSGPGFISPEALRFLSEWSRHPRKFALIIQGEDDLLVLPAIIYAPLGTIILYGQPKQGIVQLTVTEDLQQKAHEYLKKFETGV